MLYLYNLIPFAKGKVGGLKANDHWQAVSNFGALLYSTTCTCTLQFGSKTTATVVGLQPDDTEKGKLVDG